MGKMIFLADFYAITGNIDKKPKYPLGIRSDEEGLWIDKEYQANRARAFLTQDEIDATAINFPSDYVAGEPLLSFPCTLDKLLDLLDEMELWDAVDKEVLAKYEDSNASAATVCSIALEPQIPYGSDVSAPFMRKEPSGGDSLTPIVWQICYDLYEQQKRQTAVPVMKELKRLANSDDPNVKGDFLIKSTKDGVEYSLLNGKTTLLNGKQLAERIGKWKAQNSELF